MDKHSSRVALITGASRGLGRAIALGFAAAGYRVALAARDRVALEEVASEAERAGTPESLAIAVDLAQPAAPQEMVKRTVGLFGCLDVLVNNAGDTKRGDFLELSDEDHLSGFALKYHGMVRSCRSAWPHLEKSGGAIINISGVGAQTPEPAFTIGGPVNSAIINFSKALAKRARDGRPRVNVVCPGHIVTDRLRKRIAAVAEREGIGLEEAQERLRQSLEIASFGEPDDIARMVCFLASSEAAYVHGATIIVDGGSTPGI
ncbi:SDR family oxidoreductase [Nitratireductor sp. GCM10026969]|uniref:SDR family oxidoreductase n=1 Tax=Nitratireductor sp. GCM10026969 TaxID=3252645 RepID=UPI00360CAC7F